MPIYWGQPVGPLPLGAWVAVVGGGLGIAWYTRSKNAGGTQIVEDTSGNPGVGTGAGSMWIQEEAPDPAVAPNPTTNEEWARLAINYLIASGYDPAMSDIAIRKYLESSQLTVTEFALVKIALARLGAPPVPLANPAPPPATPPPTTNPPPGGTTNPPPVTSPGQFRYITVTKWPSQHGTLWGIAKTAYGNGALYPRIYNANRYGTVRADGKPGMIKNPNLIYTGWVLLIP